MNEELSRVDLLYMTTEIVSSYVSNNAMSVDELPTVIEQTYKTLSTIGFQDIISLDRPQPAVPINRSITPDFIICLEDGKKLKMLKRHLKTAYNMTPEQYRERWGLPADYPMVAPSYAQRRSKLAKDIGLGVRN